MDQEIDDVSCYVHVDVDTMQGGMRLVCSINERDYISKHSTLD